MSYRLPRTVVCILATHGNVEFEDRRHFAYTEYCRLKDDFFAFLNFVPLLPTKNLTVCSPKLSSLITDVCEQTLDCLEIWVSAPRESVKRLGGTLVLKDIGNFEAEQKRFLIKMEERKKQHLSMSYPALRIHQ